jgi:hypothetical protein
MNDKVQTGIRLISILRKIQTQHRSLNSMSNYNLSPLPTTNTLVFYSLWLNISDKLCYYWNLANEINFVLDVFRNLKLNNFDAPSLSDRPSWCEHRWGLDSIRPNTERLESANFRSNLWSVSIIRRIWGLRLHSEPRKVLVSSASKTTFSKITEFLSKNENF